MRSAASSILAVLAPQAALVIQKFFRGFCARLDLGVQWAAAQTIQAAWRAFAGRLRFGVMVHRIVLVQACTPCPTDLLSTFACTVIPTRATSSNLQYSGLDSEPRRLLRYAVALMSALRCILMEATS